MADLPEDLKRQYDLLAKMRVAKETMEKNQALRGIENHKKRMAERAATHTSWRQMKGIQLFMHEVNHPGNKPFAIGLA